MENRMISYGYEMINGKIAILPFEANIVKRIFDEYGLGKGLKQIAEELTEEKIIYFKDNYCWNKNKIARILENKKYIGEDNYPIILKLDEYEKAIHIKKEKGFQKTIPNPTIEYLKKITYCNQCGNLLNRVSNWHTKEKWICRNKCKCDIYISDEEILNKLNQTLMKVKQDLSLLSNTSSFITYQPSLEIMKYNYEINHMMNEKEINFEMIKKSILKCAKLKFNQCQQDSFNIYTTSIIEYIQKVNDVTKESLENLISKIEVKQNGNLIVTFLNGVKVFSEV